MPLSLYPEFLPEEDLARVFEKHALPCDFKGNLLSYPTFKGLTAAPQGLAFLSSWRIYTEWCMDKKNGAGKTWALHSNYHGEALGTFLNDEKLFYAQQRKYVEMPAVVDAFARSALDFFIWHCDWTEMSPKEKGVNIRRNLAPWIDNPNLIRV